MLGRAYVIAMAFLLGPPATVEGIVHLGYTLYLQFKQGTPALPSDFVVSSHAVRMNASKK